MKSSAALSLLFLLPSIRAAAISHLVGNELESTSKRDASGNLAARSPQSSEIIPDATRSMTDDPSLDPAWNVARDLSARSPQGPASNPGESIDVGLSNLNPANRHHHSNSSSSPSAGSSQTMYSDTDLGTEGLMEDGAEMERHRHHNGSHHHKWNSADHEHRKEGILTELNTHGEHIVVYNGTHFPNGTHYHPANETANGGEMLGEVVVAGDEVAVYRRPWNETHHHHRYHDVPEEGGAGPTATGFWLPSGTGWIPQATGRPRRHRKVPSPADAGFRGPKLGKWKVVV